MLYFLSFLATAQALGIEFLHIAWDAARGVPGTGGTSRIHQALLNLDTSLAFKTYHRRNQADEQQEFCTLINEITVLSQPFVREHPNIAQLQGICWDISPDDNPWPVLVFEKSHLGDLHHFTRHGGRDMTFHERLKLCVDIGRAVADMHSNQIVHGDIKPENVLVFREKSGTYSARVTDFGYSTRYFHDGDQLILPRSDPWNAPENDGRRRAWSPSDALKTDLFCFGMLAFWLLFEPSLSEIIQLGHTQKTPKIGSAGGAEAILRAIKGGLRSYAQQLLSKTALIEDKRMTLRGFFESSLSEDPAQRATGCLREFIIRLDPQWSNDQVAVPLQKEELKIRDSDFKIEHSIYEFYRTDYRVRRYIFQCLLNSSRRSACIAAQLALCFYLGFGVTRNETQAENILWDSQTIQTVQTIISSLSSEEGRASRSRAIFLSNISNLGIVRWSNFTDLYLENERLDEAETQLTQEKNNLLVVLSPSHALIGIIKTRLSDVYTVRGRWNEAEKLEMEVMETSKQKLGADHPNTLTSIANLASTYSNQGRWDEAEKLEVEVIETCKQKLGADHPDTLTSMDNLASTYSNQGRWDEAEKLQVEVMETCKQKLGADHPNTLTSMDNLASTYGDQGRWDEAEKLEVEVMEICKQKLGADL